MEKSAKDKAFDRERTKLGAQINNLRRQVIERDREIEVLKATISEKDSEIASLNDWIERLLEFTELSKEDLKKHMEDRAKSAEALSTFNSLMKITRMF